MSNGPKLEIINGGFYLTEDFKYTFPNGNYVLVPEYYVTNFASIPAIARIIISPIDKDIVVASLVHDFLVQEGVEHTSFQPGIVHPDGSIDIVDWNQAASLMRNIMLLEKSPLWKRQLVYIGIRFYGFVRRKK